MTGSRAFLPVFTFGIAAAIACGGNGTSTPQAAVYFVLDAPLCSSVVPMRFSIDNTVVGLDTFRVNLAPNHTTSHAFFTTPGMHVVSGVGVNGGFVFPARSVSLTDGASFMDTLSTSCS